MPYKQHSRVLWLVLGIFFSAFILDKLTFNVINFQKKILITQPVKAQSLPPPPQRGYRNITDTYKIDLIESESKSREYNPNLDSLARDPSLEPGFPVQTPHLGGVYQGGQGIHTLVGNIDNDPNLEIIVTALAQGPLYAWNSDGTIVNGWPVEGFSGTRYAAAGNLTWQDAGLEVISGGWTGSKPEFMAHSGSGNRLSGWTNIASAGIQTPPTLADVNGDGLDEVFFPKLYYLEAYRADGSMLPGWPLVDIGVDTPAIGDLDGNGDLEIVAGDQNADIVYAYHHDGTAVEGFPIFVPIYTNTFPVIGDVDGDNQPEIIVVSGWPMVRIFSANGILERSMPIQGEINYGSAPALADLNGDAIPEIIVQTNDALNCWHGNGSICFGWPQIWKKTFDGTGGYVQRHASPVIGDVDGDLQPDIIITLQDLSVYPYGQFGEVRVYNRQGKLHPNFPKSLKLDLGAVPAIADIDLDGHNEIIVTSAYWDGIAGNYDKVWVYDLGGGRHGKIEWGQFGGGPHHRGYYPSPPPFSGVDLDISTLSLIGTPPDSVVSIPLRYSNYGATLATNVTITATLTTSLTYIDDTFIPAPTLNGNSIRWGPLSVAYLEEGKPLIYLKVPPGATYGTRYSVLWSLSSSSPDAYFGNNVFRTEIMIARQAYLPLIVQN